MLTVVRDKPGTITPSSRSGNYGVHRTDTLKNRANWTEKETQKWESMALERCVTGLAYEMRLVLQGIYERKEAARTGSCSETGALVYTRRERK